MSIDTLVRTVGTRSGYKYDCDCFEYIQNVFGISGITGIIQQYLHMVDINLLVSKLEMPIALQYATRDDFHFKLGKKTFSGKIVWPYNSESYIFLGLNVVKYNANKRNGAKLRAKMAISVRFSGKLCATLGESVLTNKIFSFDVEVTNETADIFVNTMFIQSQKDRFVSCILDSCAQCGVNQTSVCNMLMLPIFDQACAMFHKRIVRAIYSEYHVDRTKNEDFAEDRVDIPAW